MSVTFESFDICSSRFGAKHFHAFCGQITEELAAVRRFADTSFERLDG